MYSTCMSERQADLETLDRALMSLRRFFATPRVLDDEGRDVDLSTLLVLDGLPAGGQSVNDIAARLDVAHSTASRFVTRAERAGMTTRSPSPHDARQTLVAPTEAGLALAARAADHRLDRLGGLVSDWTDDDVRAFAAHLGRFADASARR